MSDPRSDAGRPGDALPPNGAPPAPTHASSNGSGNGALHGASNGAHAGAGHGAATVHAAASHGHPPYAPGTAPAPHAPPAAGWERWSVLAAPPPIAPRPTPATAADEAVDIGGLLRTVGRGWRRLLVAGLLGVAAGAGVLAAVRPWYRSTASVLVRNANDPTGSLLSRFGLAGDLAGQAAGGALGGVLKSPLETEVQILGSRELIGRVVDSLALQARVLSPRGTPARALFAGGPIGGAFRRRTVEFARQADGTVLARHADGEARLVPGRPGTLPGIGPVTLAAGPLPERFRVRLEDREDAITRAEGDLVVEKLGGEVVKLRYDGPDSLTAAAVPNAAVTVYLELRRTVDRGLNARRYEFMAAQADTAARLLAAAEDALRREGERTGVLDPELAGRTGLEALRDVRGEFVTLEGERRAARALVDAVERGTLGPRQLIAFPSFLRAPAINAILSQLTQLETERTRLLGTRTERDPDVEALTASITQLERNLLPLARSYVGSLDRQAEQLLSEQGSVERRLAALPGQAESTLRLQRDVKRLSQVVLGLQAQMIDARLASLTEGGQVRRVDVAVAPKRPLFPRAIWTLPAGLVLGLLGGVVWVLARSAWSSRVRDARDAERAAGLSAVRWRPGSPLLLGGVGPGVHVAVGPHGGAAVRRVAEALAAQARARGLAATVLDATGATDEAVLAAELRRLARPGEVLCVAAPPIDHAAVAVLLAPPHVAVLVAEEGVTSRDALAEAAAVVGRCALPALGTVVVDGAPLVGRAPGAASPALASAR